LQCTCTCTHHLYPTLTPHTLNPHRMREVPTNVNLSTVGIVVSDWTYYRKVRGASQTSLKSITFMTWDFGGQEEYYATHQCFLSRRSLYLVVWNVTHFMEGAEELKPWLLNIQVQCNSLCIHGTSNVLYTCMIYDDGIPPYTSF